MSISNQINVELLQGYLDNMGAAIVEEMLDLYIKQSAIYLKEISSAIACCSQSDWQESCHKMKGAAGSVGMLNVHQNLVALEKSIDTWTVKEAAVEKLIQLNNQSVIGFKQWLASNDG